MGRPIISITGSRGRWRVVVDNVQLAVALSEAHAANDHAALVRVYGQIADAAEMAGEIDSACFFLTQAYVFALENGAPEATMLEDRLRHFGRVD